jgi:signal transduction histidine kinase
MSEPTKEFSTVYRSYQSGWSISATRVACILVAVLIMGGSVLDWATHPDQLGTFVWYRLATAISALMLYGVTYFETARPYAKQLFLLPIFLTAFCIQIMIQQMPDGYASSYYAGLNLCILGFAITVTLSLMETVFVCLAIVGMWVFGAAIGRRAIEFGPFFNNIFFLTGTSLIAIGSTLIRNKVAEREFQSFYAHKLLQERDLQKNKFFANISHELRTPLVALSSTVQMLLDGGLREPELQRKLLLSSQDSLEDMLENVNDLLLKARSEKNLVDMQWTQLDAAEFVERALSVFETIASKRNLRLRFVNKADEPLWLYVDRAKLKKIINNLVGNAIKFTRNGDVTVTMEKTSSHCVISVQDTGQGIPEADIESIFDPFVQASNNTQRDVQGTGIGLALVKDLVELHKGKISVESQVGAGSVFRVELLLGEAHVDMNQLDASALTDEQDSRVNLKASMSDIDLSAFQQHQPGRANILLVEDNPQVVQVLAYVLNDQYNLHFASDGEEGLEQAHKLRPDLVISDVMMPKKTGYDLVRDIKVDPILKSTPVILLTSKVARESRLLGFSHGADEYLAKPFNNEEILVRVRGLLERRKLEIEMVHAEKLISVGQLAAGVAHEINNPISFAKNAAGTIEDVFAAVQAGTIPLQEGMEMMRDAIERVKEGTQRVADITSALRGFVRQGASGFHPCDIHQALDATLQIIHANHKNTVRFEKRYSLDASVECNINQLNQVFMNLLQNAVHAVESKNDALIIIETKRCDDNPEWVNIIVQDNGVGIPKARLERIFDPFFTTKKLGEGTGLGLHIARNIVVEHNGSISASSIEGEGTRFDIRLPLTQPSAEARTEPARFTHPSIDQGLETVQYPAAR